MIARNAHCTCGSTFADFQSSAFSVGSPYLFDAFNWICKNFGNGVTLLYSFIHCIRPLGLTHILLPSLRTPLSVRYDGYMRIALCVDVNLFDFGHRSWWNIRKVNAALRFKIALKLRWRLNCTKLFPQLTLLFENTSCCHDELVVSSNTLTTQNGEVCA